MTDGVTPMRLLSNDESALSAALSEWLPSCDGERARRAVLALLEGEARQGEIAEEGRHDHGASAART